MPVAGEQYTPHLDVPNGDVTTVAALTLLDADDMTSVPAVFRDPDATHWSSAPITLVGGEYRFYWTVAGAGAESSTLQILTVDPDPDAIPAGFSFATVADLVAYTGQSLPPGGRRLLINASREIERITKSAVYRTGPDGRPTDPDLRRALADATCELIGWWDETGTETGARGLFTSAGIAGVSLGFGGQGASNPQADRVGPRVWSILLNAGLLNPGAVQTYG